MERRPCLWFFLAALWRCHAWTGAPCGERAFWRTSSRWLTGTSRPQACVPTRLTAWWTCMPPGNAEITARSSDRRWVWPRTLLLWGISHFPSWTWSRRIKACTPATCITTTVVCKRGASSDSAWGLPFPPARPQRPESYRMMGRSRVSQNSTKECFFFHTSKGLFCTPS